MYLDRFYTPDSLATTLVRSLPAPIQSCVDPTCGSGALLRATEMRFPRVACSGLDIDPRAIAKARRVAPHWTLSVGDILDPASRSRTTVVGRARGVELVVCNPPFSMGSGKGVSCEFLPGERCSVAMAHLLAAIEIFNPHMGLAAVVPESLVYSDLDARGREALRRYGRIDVVGEGPCDSFAGARANTLLLNILRARRTHTYSPPAPDILVTCRLVRGGLPVHDARLVRSGRLFVHTTDFELLRSEGVHALRRVRPFTRGIVRGDAVLLPRVGTPIARWCHPVHLPDSVQISDCVFALCFPSQGESRRCVDILLANWRALSAQYRGTGARYITQRRLADWLRGVGVGVQEFFSCHGRQHE